MIECKKISFSYPSTQLETPIRALRDVSFTLGRGRYLAILGQNGSGKSTLARTLNGLLIPQSGSVTVDGMDTTDDNLIYQIRRLCGMVFQNPDNQIIGMTVEEDVAFGLENIGVPREEMLDSIKKALELVGLSGKGQYAPYNLSGGQKQKLAIAGVIAMKPQYLVLDEATAMLDPKTRSEIMNLVIKLCREEGISVVNITHHMNEALLADEVIVLDQGEIVISGTPREVFAEPELILKHHLEIPVHLQTYLEVARQLGKPVDPKSAFSFDEAHGAMLALLDGHSQTATEVKHVGSGKNAISTEAIIEVDELSCVYNENTTQSTIALNDVSFELRRGEIVGVAGHTGSGKSTLIMHLNGLLRSTKGKVIVFGQDASVPNSIRDIRKRVGIVFQYPEHQLFEETVARDIAFGPTKMGLSAEEVERRVLASAKLVGFVGEEILMRSPFELSGGQKRRVALAGVLAMNPDVLILDEPAAGLDPWGRKEILATIKALSDNGVTVIIVSHNMDDLAQLCNRLLIFNQGKLYRDGSVEAVFGDEVGLGEARLEVPDLQRFLTSFVPTMPNLNLFAHDVVDAASELVYQSCCKTSTQWGIHES